MALISELFLTSSCFYLWISASNPKLLPPGPEINGAVSLPALILRILSAEPHCCLLVGIEEGVGSVVLATLAKAEEEFSRWLFSHFLVPILIHLIWSHSVRGSFF